MGQSQANRRGGSVTDKYYSKLGLLD